MKLLTYCPKRQDAPAIQEVPGWHTPRDSRAGNGMPRVKRLQAPRNTHTPSA